MLIENFNILTKIWDYLKFINSGIMDYNYDIVITNITMVNVLY